MPSDENENLRDCISATDMFNGIKSCSILLKYKKKQKTNKKKIPHNDCIDVYSMQDIFLSQKTRLYYGLAIWMQTHKKACVHFDLMSKLKQFFKVLYCHSFFITDMCCEGWYMASPGHFVNPSLTLEKQKTTVRKFTIQVLSTGLNGRQWMNDHYTCIITGRNNRWQWSLVSFTLSKQA